MKSFFFLHLLFVFFLFEGFARIVLVVLFVPGFTPQFATRHSSTVLHAK